MAETGWGTIDLHAHSAMSDGTESPSELVRQAQTAGLGTVAITDHDSTIGWADATRTALEIGMDLIPGMEFSTRNFGYSVHLLAYLFDPLDRELTDEMARIRDDRFTRAERIVERISMDYDLQWEDVLAQAGPDVTIGRPHIADALVARGHVLDRSEAFDSILHPRTPYYFPHYAPALIDAVRLVRAAGGVPVLAHPATHGAKYVVPSKVLAELVDAGLFGLEVDHRLNTPDGKERLRVLAARFGLVMTGSSDWHGSGKQNLLGENTTSPDVLDAIVDAATGWAPVIGRP